jgi:hypothetical protein
MVIPSATVSSRLINPHRCYDRSKEKLLMNSSCYCLHNCGELDNKPRFKKVNRFVGIDVTIRRTWYILYGPCVGIKNGHDQLVTNDAAPIDHIQQTSLTSIETSSLDESTMLLLSGQFVRI